jgi:hypothetical protein
VGGGECSAGDGRLTVQCAWELAAPAVHVLQTVSFCCLMLSGVQGQVVGLGGLAHGLIACTVGWGGSLLLLLGGMQAVLQSVEACRASAIQHAAG